MTMLRLTSIARTVSLVLLVTAVGACAKKDVLPKGGQPDKFLFDRGTSSLSEKHWLTARRYFRRIIDSYPQSTYRTNAKLGLADAYLGENTTESLILAANEYKEFLTFYPTSPRADYAQYQLGMTHFKQMRSSQRDQTETRAAVLEFQIFMARYPHSSMAAEGEARLREARDRLSTHDYEVGVFYYRTHWYPGAIDRLKTLLKDDPGYTGRDGAYYYLGESLAKVKLGAEALPYFEKLISEFTASEYLERAKQRRDELLASLDMKQRPAPADPATDKPATSAQSSAAPQPVTPKGR